MKLSKFSKFVLLAVFLICSAGFLYSQQLAFPTAEGYGKYATGGRGGRSGRVGRAGATKTPKKSERGKKSKSKSAKKYHFPKRGAERRTPGNPNTIYV